MSKQFHHGTTLSKVWLDFASTCNVMPALPRTNFSDALDNNTNDSRSSDKRRAPTRTGVTRASDDVGKQSPMEV